jgi:GNAT superfamily N-acetyltransferase
MTHENETPGLIRKLWLGETKNFRAHLLRLDNESRANRFGTHVSDYFIEQYSAHALGADSIVHGYFVDGILRGCAELRGFRMLAKRSAEAAFSIEKSFQNNGVGSLLMGRTILAARNRGVKKLFMNCLSHNHPMQSIARKHRADLKFEMGDVVAEITNAQPDPLSLFREFVADGCGFGTAILDAQHRMLRAA